MAHIKEITIESGKTLEEGGSYRKQGRIVRVAFDPGEWTVSAPPEDDDGNAGDWKPIMNALGKQADNWVDEALGLRTTKAPTPEKKDEQKPEGQPPKGKPREKFKIHDPESP